ncbi:MAG: hypothetical protein A2066_12890 [Bacteroidetes bacterium GWB2_41_8]|nr:MAG: hypothetical protein A2066_12890 [Bacteroidetes bacterium GWB2_41_8]
MDEKILAWIQSEEKDFDQGYLLLSKVLKNQSILHYLQRKRDQAKLEYELSKLVPAIVEKAVEPGLSENHVTDLKISAEKVAKHDGKLKIVQSGQINYDELPEALKPIYDNNISKYKEMRSVHEKMKLATSDEQRAELRKTLDELDNEIDSGWIVINAWAKSGKLPEAEKTGKVIDFKAVNAARTYVSRAIEKAETTTGKKLEKLVADLQIRVDTLIAAAAEIKPETLEKLEKLGIIVSAVPEATPTDPDPNTTPVVGNDESEEDKTKTADAEEPEAPVAE